MGAEIEIDPEGFERRLGQYVEWLRVNHFSEVTAADRGKYLRYFLAWAADRGLTRPAEITKPILERYQKHVFHYRKADGDPLSLASQQNYLTSIRGFFKWLARQNLILYNPASEILLPRLGKRLPKHVLSTEEIERVINEPDVKTPLGVRDRAILETLYSTGMRKMELVPLQIYDLDPDRGTVMIREGKGRRQRMIPIGDRALGWIQKYLHEVRPELAVEPDEGFIFLTRYGYAFEPNSVGGLVREYLDRAEIKKVGAVHLFRHAMATHMLEGGADIRFIQAMLGQSKLETTQIYTQVSIKKLKEVHTATHPAKMKLSEANSSTRRRRSR